MQWKALRAIQLHEHDNVLRLPNSLPLPLPQAGGELMSLFVRSCYRLWFALFVEAVSQRPHGKFALSGTPGIGKSLSVLYLFVAMQSVDSLKNMRILYHHESCFYLYSPDGSVVEVSAKRADALVLQRDTFYIIDSQFVELIPRTMCLTLFVSSPRNKYFKYWCKQRMVQPWYLPVWTLEEIVACRTHCYSSMDPKVAVDLFQQYGGVARYVFWTESPFSVVTAPPSLLAFINDPDARNSIGSVGEPSRLFPTSHMLVHIIVNDRLRFVDFGLASSFIGVLLFKEHLKETIDKLSSMLGSGGALAGHLFECYGHFVFEHGGDNLDMRSLEGSMSLSIVGFACSDFVFPRLLRRWWHQYSVSSKKECGVFPKRASTNQSVY